MFERARRGRVCQLISLFASSGHRGELVRVQVEMIDFANGFLQLELSETSVTLMHNYVPQVGRKMPRIKYFKVLCCDAPLVSAPN